MSIYGNIQSSVFIYRCLLTVFLILVHGTEVTHDKKKMNWGSSELCHKVDKAKQKALGFMIISVWNAEW